MSQNEIKVTADKAGIASKVNPATKAIKDTAKEVENLKGKPGTKSGLEGVNTALKDTLGNINKVSKGFKDLFTSANGAANQFFKDANKQADTLISKLAQAKGLMGGATPAGANGQPGAPGAQPAPTPAAGGTGVGGAPPPGGTPPGQTPTPSNSPGYQKILQKMRGSALGKAAFATRMASVAAGTVANIYDIYGDIPLKQARNDATRAGQFGDVYSRMVTGDLSDIMFLGNKGLLGETREAGVRAGTSSKFNTVAKGVSGIADATTSVAFTAAGFGVGGFTGAAIGNTLGPDFGTAVGKVGGAVTDWKTGGNEAAKVRGFMEMLERKKQADPVFMRTLEYLSANGSNVARQHRLFGGEGNFSYQVANSAKFGMQGGEVMQLQQQLSGLMGVSNANRHFSTVAGAETSMGINRASAAGALAGMIQSEAMSPQEADRRLREIMAKAMSLGIKDSNLKEGIAETIAKYSYGEGGKIAGGGVAMAGIQTAMLSGGDGSQLHGTMVEKALAAANQMFTAGTGGGPGTLRWASTVQTIDAIKARHNRKYKNDPTKQIGELSPAIAMGLANMTGAERLAGGSEFTKEEWSRHNFDPEELGEAIATTNHRNVRQGAEYGGGGSVGLKKLISKLSKERGADGKLKYPTAAAVDKEIGRRILEGDSVSSVDSADARYAVREAGYVQSQLNGWGNAGLDKNSAGLAYEAQWRINAAGGDASKANLTPEMQKWYEAAQKAQSDGQDGSTAGAAAATSAGQAAELVLKSLGDAELRKGLENVSSVAGSLTKIVGTLSNAYGDPTQKLEKLGVAITNLGIAVEGTLDRLGRAGIKTD